MKSNCFLRLIIFFVLLTLALPAAAEPLSEAEARAFGETKGRELLNTFAEKDPAVKYKKLDELFLNYVDLDYISRFVVGKYWRQMSAEQQKKYQELFTRYALNVYKGFPLSFDDNLDFVISDVERDGEYALVRTNIDYRGMDGKATTFLVEFRVHKKNGRIMITDIKVAESSLILSYRGRFYQMIADADEEMEWFLEDFELLADSGENSIPKRKNSSKKHAVVCKSPVCRRKPGISFPFFLRPEKAKAKNGQKIKNGGNRC